MTVVVEIAPVEAEHIVAVAAAMRPADRDEVWASSRSEPVDALLRSVLASTDACVGLMDGEPACLFGVAPLSLLSGRGSPWMLGTDLVDRNPVPFLRRCRPVVARWLSVYPTLENHVDARNVVAQRWLRWLGFTLEEARPHGPDGMLFHPFHLRLGA